MDTERRSEKENGLDQSGTMWDGAPYLWPGVGALLKAGLAAQ